MDKTEALSRLRERERDLRSLGVGGLSLFGSTARGDQHDSSDVDLAVTLTDKEHRTLFDLVAIQLAAADILGADVDLVSEPARKVDLRTEIERDRVRVF